MGKLRKRKAAVGAAAALLGVWIWGICAQAEETGRAEGPSEKVYREMDTGSAVMANVLGGTEFTVLSSGYDTSGRLWYYIRTDMGTEGYIPGERVIMEGQGGTEDSPPQEEGAEGTESGGRIRTTDKVNVRESASTDGALLGEIPIDTVLEYEGMEENEIGETWYEITYGDLHGYIRESTVSLEGAGAAPEEVGGEGTGLPPGVSPGEETETQPLPTGTDSTLPGIEGMPLDTDIQPETEEENGPEDETAPEEAGGDKTALAGTEARETGKDPNAAGTETAAGKEKGKEINGSGRQRADWVILGALAGSLACLAVLVYLTRRIIRICKGRG